MVEIVSEYEKLINNIDKIIDLSPYKTSYIIERLGLSPANYHRKKKKKSFNLKEMKVLAEMFNTEEMEDKLLAVYSEKVEREEKRQLEAS